MNSIPIEPIIRIFGGRLRVGCPESLNLTTGFRLTFFTNIAGFTLDINSREFSRPVDSGTGSAIEAVCRFFKSKSISFNLDSAAEAYVKARSTAGQTFNAAREAGAKIHQTELFDQPLIPGFKRILKKYQVLAVAHMVAVKHSGNFSVPGSGKTTMVLAAYAILREDSLDQIVIIGPRSCFAPWEEEFEGCFGRPPRSIRLSGTPAERATRYTEARGADVDIILVTYQTAANDCAQLVELLKNKKTMLVLDESHYVKRLSGGVWAPAMLELAPFAAKRVILTGTPVPNGIEDIWSQMTFLWPDPPLLGTRERFTDRVQTGGSGMAGEIRDELLPLFWRVKKSDVDLPEPIFYYISVSMKPYQAAIYRAIGIKVLSDIEASPVEREKLRLWRKAKMVRLLQAASNPSLLTEHSPEFEVPPLNAAGLTVSQLIENYSDYEVPAKVEMAVKLVESILAKDPHAKVVVWSAFVHNLVTLDKALANYEPRVIHGKVPKDASEDSDFNREGLIRDFKTNPRYRVMLANPGACAESISLHKICKHAIYMDRSFNGAQYMQSLDRIHRLGLERADIVHYYVLKATETVDELVNSRLEDKRKCLIRLLEGDLATIDLDNDDVTEASEEVGDFEAMVQQLREQLSKPESL